MYVLLKQEVWWAQPLRNIAISYLFVAAPQKLYPVWILNGQNLSFRAHLMNFYIIKTL